MSNIDFYFDFASPYAYLAHCRLPALADKYGYGITYKPIDLFAARRAAGNSGPPSAQIPPKFRYVTTDLKRWAQKYDAPFVMPWAAKSGDSNGAKKVELQKEWIDSSRAHKGMFFANERGQGRDYATRLWRATFGSGGFVGDPELLRGVAQDMGWSPDGFLEFIQSDQAERLYEETNREAHARGVFGVPIMFVDDEMWWGNDRLSFLEEHLAAHPAR